MKVKEKIEDRFQCEDYRDAVAEPVQFKNDTKVPSNQTNIYNSQTPPIIHENDMDEQNSPKELTTREVSLDTSETCKQPTHNFDKLEPARHTQILVRGYNGLNRHSNGDVVSQDVVKVGKLDVTALDRVSLKPNMESEEKRTTTKQAYSVVNQADDCEEPEALLEQAVESGKRRITSDNVTNIFRHKACTGETVIPNEDDGRSDHAKENDHPREMGNGHNIVNVGRPEETEHQIHTDVDEEIAIGGTFHKTIKSHPFMVKERRKADFVKSNIAFTKERIPKLQSDDHKEVMSDKTEVESMNQAIQHSRIVVDKITRLDQSSGFKTYVNEPGCQQDDDTISRRNMYNASKTQNVDTGTWFGKMGSKEYKDMRETFSKEDEARYSQKVTDSTQFAKAPVDRSRTTATEYLVPHQDHLKTGSIGLATVQNGHADLWFGLTRPEKLEERNVDDTEPAALKISDTHQSLKDQRESSHTGDVGNLVPHLYQDPGKVPSEKCTPEVLTTVQNGDADLWFGNREPIERKEFPKTLTNVDETQHPRTIVDRGAFSGARKDSFQKNDMFLHHGYNDVVQYPSKTSHSEQLTTIQNGDADLWFGKERPTDQKEAIKVFMNTEDRQRSSNVTDSTQFAKASVDRSRTKTTEYLVPQLKTGSFELATVQNGHADLWLGMTRPKELEELPESVTKVDRMEPAAVKISDTHQPLKDQRESCHTGDVGNLVPHLYQDPVKVPSEKRTPEVLTTVQNGDADLWFGKREPIERKEFTKTLTNMDETQRPRTEPENAEDDLKKIRDNDHDQTKENVALKIPDASLPQRRVGTEKQISAKTADHKGEGLTYAYLAPNQIFGEILFDESTQKHAKIVTMERKLTEATFNDVANTKQSISDVSTTATQGIVYNQVESEKLWTTTQKRKEMQDVLIKSDGIYYPREASDQNIKPKPVDRLCVDHEECNNFALQDDISMSQEKINTEHIMVPEFQTKVSDKTGEKRYSKEANVERLLVDEQVDSIVRGGRDQDGEELTKYTTIKLHDVPGERSTDPKHILGETIKDENVQETRKFPYLGATAGKLIVQDIECGTFGRKQGPSTTDDNILQQKFTKDAILDPKRVIVCKTNVEKPRYSKELDVGRLGIKPMKVKNDVTGHPGLPKYPIKGKSIDMSLSQKQILDPGKVRRETMKANEDKVDNVEKQTEDKELIKFLQNFDECYACPETHTQEIKHQLDQTSLLRTPATGQKLTIMQFEPSIETLEKATHAKDQEIGRILVKEMSRKQEKVETCKAYPVKRKNIGAVIKKEHMLDISRLVQKQQITQDDKTELHTFEKIPKEPEKGRQKLLNKTDKVFTASQKLEQMDIPNYESNRGIITRDHKEYEKIKQQVDEASWSKRKVDAEGRAVPTPSKTEQICSQKFIHPSDEIATENKLQSHTEHVKLYGKRFEKPMSNDDVIEKKTAEDMCSTLKENVTTQTDRHVLQVINHTPESSTTPKPQVLTKKDALCFSRKAAGMEVHSQPKADTFHVKDDEENKLIKKSPSKYDINMARSYASPEIIIVAKDYIAQSDNTAVPQNRQKLNSDRLIVDEVPVSKDDVSGRITTPKQLIQDSILEVKEERHVISDPISGMGGITNNKELVGKETQAGKDYRSEDHQRLTFLEGVDYYKTKRHKSRLDDVDLVSSPRGTVTSATDKQQIEHLETPMYLVKQAVGPAVVDEKLQRKAKEQVNKKDPKKARSIDIIVTKNNVSDASNILQTTIPHAKHSEINPRIQVKGCKIVKEKHQRNTDDASRPETSAIEKRRAEKTEANFLGQDKECSQVYDKGRATDDTNTIRQYVATEKAIVPVFEGERGNLRESAKLEFPKDQDTERTAFHDCNIDDIGRTKVTRRETTHVRHETVDPKNIQDAAKTCKVESGPLHKSRKYDALQEQATPVARGAEKHDKEKCSGSYFDISELQRQVTEGNVGLSKRNEPQFENITKLKYPTGRSIELEEGKKENVAEDIQMYGKYDDRTATDAVVRKKTASDISRGAPQDNRMTSSKIDIQLHQTPKEYKDGREKTMTYTRDKVNYSQKIATEKKSPVDVDRLHVGELEHDVRSKSLEDETCVGQKDVVTQNIMTPRGADPHTEENVKQKYQNDLNVGRLVIEELHKKTSNKLDKSWNEQEQTTRFYANQTPYDIQETPGAHQKTMYKVCEPDVADGHLQNDDSACRRNIGDATITTANTDETKRIADHDQLNDKNESIYMKFKPCFDKTRQIKSGVLSKKIAVKETDEFQQDCLENLVHPSENEVVGTTPPKSDDLGERSRSVCNQRICESDANDPTLFQHDIMILPLESDLHKSQINSEKLNIREIALHDREKPRKLEELPLQSAKIIHHDDKIKISINQKDKITERGYVQDRYEHIHETVEPRSDETRKIQGYVLSKKTAVAKTGGLQQERVEKLIQPSEENVVSTTFTKSDEQEESYGPVLSQRARQKTDTMHFQPFKQDMVETQSSTTYHRAMDGGNLNLRKSTVYEKEKPRKMEEHPLQNAEMIQPHGKTKMLVNPEDDTSVNDFIVDKHRKRDHHTKPRFDGARQSGNTVSSKKITLARPDGMQHDSLENVVDANEHKVPSTTMTKKEESKKCSRPIFRQRAERRTETMDLQPFKQDMMETLSSTNYQRQMNGEKLNLCQGTVYEKEKPTRVEKRPLQNVEMVQQHGKTEMLVIPEDDTPVLGYIVDKHRKRDHHTKPRFDGARQIGNTVSSKKITLARPDGMQHDSLENVVHANEHKVPSTTMTKKEESKECSRPIFRQRAERRTETMDLQPFKQDMMETLSMTNYQRQMMDRKKLNLCQGTVYEKEKPTRVEERPLQNVEMVQQHDRTKMVVNREDDIAGHDYIMDKHTEGDDHIKPLFDETKQIGCGVSSENINVAKTDSSPQGHPEYFVHPKEKKVISINLTKGEGPRESSRPASGQGSRRQTDTIDFQPFKQDMMETLPSDTLPSEAYQRQIGREKLYPREGSVYEKEIPRKVEERPLQNSEMFQQHVKTKMFVNPEDDTSAHDFIEDKHRERDYHTKPTFDKTTQIGSVVSSEKFTLARPDGVQHDKLKNVVDANEHKVASTTMTKKEEPKECSRPIFSQRAARRTETMDLQPFKQDMIETLSSTNYQRQMDGEKLNLRESTVYEKEKPTRVEERPLQNVEMVQQHDRMKMVVNPEDDIPWHGFIVDKHTERDDHIKPLFDETKQIGCGVLSENITVAKTDSSPQGHPENFVHPKEQKMISIKLTKSDEPGESSRPASGQSSRQQTDTIDFQPFEQDVMETLPSKTYQRQIDSEKLYPGERTVYEKKEPGKVEERPLRYAETLQHHGKTKMLANPNDNIAECGSIDDKYIEKYHDIKPHFDKTKQIGSAVSSKNITLEKTGALQLDHLDNLRHPNEHKVSTATLTQSDDIEDRFIPATGQRVRQTDVTNPIPFSEKESLSSKNNEKKIKMIHDEKLEQGNVEDVHYDIKHHANKKPNSDQIQASRQGLVPIEKQQSRQNFVNFRKSEYPEECVTRRTQVEEMPKQIEEMRKVTTSQVGHRRRKPTEFPQSSRLQKRSDSDDIATSRNGAKAGRVVVEEIPLRKEVTSKHTVKCPEKREVRNGACEVDRLRETEKDIPNSTTIQNNPISLPLKEIERPKEVIIKQRRMDTSACRPVDHVLVGLQVPSEDVRQVDPEHEVWKDVEPAIFDVVDNKSKVMKGDDFGEKKRLNDYGKDNVTPQEYSEESMPLSYTDNEKRAEELIVSSQNVQDTKTPERKMRQLKIKEKPRDESGIQKEINVTQKQFSHQSDRDRITKEKTKYSHIADKDTMSFPKTEEKRGKDKEKKERKQEHIKEVNFSREGIEPRRKEKFREKSKMVEYCREKETSKRNRQRRPRRESHQMKASEPHRVTEKQTGSRIYATQFIHDPSQSRAKRASRTLPWIEIRRKEKQTKVRDSMVKKKHHSRTQDSHGRDRLLLLKVPQQLYLSMQRNDTAERKEIVVPWMEIQASPDTTGDTDCLPWIQVEARDPKTGNDRLIMLKIPRDMMLKTTEYPTNTEKEIQLPWHDVTRYWEETGQISKGSTKHVTSGDVSSMRMSFRNNEESTSTMRASSNTRSTGDNLPTIRLIMPKKLYEINPQQNRPFINFDPNRQIKLKFNHHDTSTAREDFRTIRLTKDDCENNYIPLALTRDCPKRVLLVDGNEWRRLEVDNLETLEKENLQSHRSRFCNAYEIGRESESHTFPDLCEFTKEKQQKELKRREREKKTFNFFINSQK